MKESRYGDPLGIPSLYIGRQILFVSFSSVSMLGRNDVVVVVVVSLVIPKSAVHHV